MNIKTKELLSRPNHLHLICQTSNSGSLLTAVVVQLIASNVLACRVAECETTLLLDTAVWTLVPLLVAGVAVLVGCAGGAGGSIVVNALFGIRRRNL